MQLGKCLVATHRLLSCISANEFCIALNYSWLQKGHRCSYFSWFFTLSRLLKFWKVDASWVKNRFDAIRIPSPQSGEEVTH